MGRYRDLLPSDQNWINSLAKAEIHPDADELLNLGNTLSPDQLVEESTIEFLSETREEFEKFAQVFNAYSERGSRFQEVKLYSVAQSPADFMVFRNQIKLVISNPTPGVIQIALARHATGMVAGNGRVQEFTQALEKSNAFEKPQELLAQVGPFRNVYWTFQGEKVEPSQLARYYFAEFVRISRANRSKTRTKVLLDQIKTLLDGKDLDL